MLGGDSTLQIIIKAVDQATGVFKSVEASVKRTQTSFADTAAASQRFAIGLGIAATAAGGLGYAALKAAGDMEQTTVAFTTMLGSGEKAQQFIQQLIQFAKTTPFTLTGLETASKQLLAYGFAQEDVLPNLKALGDIAAGVGMDKLPNLILAFGQVKAATHLTGMELRQFTEAGVPLLDALAEEFNKPVSAIQDMISAGQIGFPAVEQALKSLTEGGGRFNNLMDKQSHTLEGMISNLEDAWNIFLTGEGQKLLEWAKALTEALIYFVQNVLPPLIDSISVVVDWFGRHKEAIMIVAGAIVGALTPAIISMTLALAAAALALAPWVIGGALIGGLVAGLIWLAKNWETVWGGIKIGFKDTVNFLIGLAEGFANTWVDAANVIIGALNSIKVSIPDWVPKIGGKSFGVHIEKIAPVSLPRLEFGGLVPGPIGTAVPIIAHGGETVLPANATTRGMTPVYQVNVNYPQVRSRSDVDYMRQQIEAALRDVVRGHKLATI